MFRGLMYGSFRGPRELLWIIGSVIFVMFAASTSFLSPVGYQTNTMIYGTGVYRFTDFVKVGAPLNLLLMVVTSVAIYLLWPLGG